MKYFRILSFIITGIIITHHSYASNFTIQQNLSTGECKPYRILGNFIENEYWVVAFAHGLFLLEETDSDIWNVTAYNIGSVFDACGPDQNGYIYCCCNGSISKTRILVFDTISKTVVEDIYIADDIFTTSILLSPDQTTLFMLGMDWPRVGEWYDFYLDANEHPLSGRIWMIDTSSYEISPDVIQVGAQPWTLYYADNPITDKIFVYTQEYVGYSSTFTAGWHDIIELTEGYPRTERFLAGFNPGYEFMNDMVTWSADDYQMALCNMLNAQEDEYPEFEDGIWIIDTITNDVIRTIKVIDSKNYPCGVTHMCISKVNPGIAYLGPGVHGRLNEILVLDMECGEVIDIIDLGNIWVHEKFIYEIPDGRLIVTGGISSNIVIIDPT